MIKSKVYDLLKQYLGEYLYGLQEDQLDVALLSGHINFSNANFKPNKVNELLVSLGLPFHLKAGLIGNLQMKYHYMSWSSNPMEIVIDELFIILGPIINQSSEPAHDRLETFASDEELSNEDLFSRGGGDIESGPTLSDSSDITITEVDSPEPIRTIPVIRNQDPVAHHRHPEDFAYSSTHASHSANATPRPANMSGQPPAKQEEGFFERYISKVLKNLTLTVKTVHIRYEDETYPYCHPYSFGICLDSMVIKTAPQEWLFGENGDITKRTPNKQTTVKECYIEKMGIYMNSMSGMLVPTSLWEATLASPIGIFEAFPAYELREIILQESSEILSGRSSCTLIDPFDMALCITLSPVAPKLKISVILQKITMKFSAAMAECCRNFFDYFTNVQLWWSLRRYRPYERIISIPRTDSDPSALKRRRRRIIKKWFEYAFRFIRAKRKLIKYIKKRRRQIQKEREKEELYDLKYKYSRRLTEPPSAPLDISTISNLDRSQQENKSPNNTNSSFVSSTPSKNDKADNKPEPRTFSFLNFNRPRVTPGVRTDDLTEAVNEYNRKKLLQTVSAKLLPEPVPNKLPAANPEPRKQLPPPVPKPEPRPADVQYFPSYLEFSEMDIRAAGWCFILYDEDTKIELKIDAEKFSISSRCSSDEVRGGIQATELSLYINDAVSKHTILKLGKKEVFVEEVVRQGIFGSLQKKKTVKEPEIEALRASFYFRPGEFRLKGEHHEIKKMYELKSHLAPLKIIYSQMIMNNLMALYESFHIDKNKRLHMDIEYIRRLEKKKSQITHKEKFILFERKMLQKRELKKAVLTKAFAKRLIRWQQHLKSWVRKMDYRIIPIHFHFLVKTNGLNFSFHEESVHPECEIVLPSGDFEAIKENRSTKVTAFGFGGSTSNSLSALYNYFNDLAEVFGAKYQHMVNFFSAFKSY
jgi:hypothetical protein